VKHILSRWLLPVAALLLFVSAGIAAEPAFPSRENPILVDKNTATVLIYTEVNARGLQSTNPHWGVVSVDGSLSDKAILKTYANYLAFHAALVSIGAHPGDNLTKDNTGVTVEGDRLDVTATWPGLGKELSLSEIFADESGKGFDIRFGGNREMSQKAATGCVMCLESCWVAVTSNARYPNISDFRRMLSPNSRFKGKAEVLPASGEPVILIFRLVHEN
jgi:hypothetical protein